LRMHHTGPWSRSFVRTSRIHPHAQPPPPRRTAPSAERASRFLPV
jgi:hypothetical protein